MPDCYAVLLQDPAGAETGVLGRFFAAAFQIPFIDAQRRARRAWGFLGEKMPPAEAEALAGRAAAAGLSVRVLPESAVAVPPPPVLAGGGRLEDAALVLTVGVPPTEHRIPLDTLTLFFTTVLRQETVVTRTEKEGPSAGERVARIGITLATGIPLGGFGGGKEVTKTTRTGDFSIVSDFFTSKGERYRVDPSRFAFSGLGGSWTGLENVRRLLQTLAPRAPRALANRGARALMESRPLASLGYDDASDFEKECRWILTLTRTPA